MERGTKEKYTMNNEESSTGKPINTVPSFISGLSCKRFIAYAILLSLLYMGAHLLGFREYTAVLSGTASFSKRHQFFGAFYIIFYMCFVVIVPVLLIASVLTEMRVIIKRYYMKGSK